ncbi:tape measure protein [Campylobacter sp. MOP7]|uniref:tape measure protein n=1 Tax=Campylobacter canis TaxID=3378588 RepID=UPI00387E8E5E
MTTSSMGEFTRQQKEMHKIARDTHSSIKDVTNLYVKLAPALKGVGKSTQEINKITSSFTKALQLGGASAEESASAIKQFGQAMGSGVLRGEEFNAIAEASPTLLRYLAEGLNVPIGKLRELGSQGKLTAEALANAFDKMNDKISADFKNMPLTVGKAVTDLRTEITLLTNEINQTAGVTQGISEIIAGVSDIIKENKDGIVSVTPFIFITFYISFLDKLYILFLL